MTDPHLEHAAEVRLLGGSGRLHAPDSYQRQGSHSTQTHGRVPNHLVQRLRGPRQLHLRVALPLSAPRLSPRHISRRMGRPKQRDTCMVPIRVPLRLLGMAVLPTKAQGRACTLGY